MSQSLKRKVVGRNGIFGTTARRFELQKSREQLPKCHQTYWRDKISEFPDAAQKNRPSQTRFSIGLLSRHGKPFILEQPLGKSRNKCEASGQAKSTLEKPSMSPQQPRNSQTHSPKPISKMNSPNAVATQAPFGTSSKRHDSMRNIDGKIFDKTPGAGAYDIHRELSWKSPVANKNVGTFGTATRHLRPGQNRFTRQHAGPGSYDVGESMSFLLLRRPKPVLNLFICGFKVLEDPLIYIIARNGFIEIPAKLPRY
eukprot:10265541-Ditylum_brightwellii.AAC.1